MDELTEYIRERHIDGVFAEQLEALSTDAKREVVDLCIALEPSANTLRAYVELASQIAARDRQPLACILAATSLRETLALEKVQKKEKQRRYRDLLESARYPARTALQEELNALQKQMIRESGLKIEYPRDLEGETITVSFRAVSCEELQNSAAKVAALAALPASQRLFALLRGEEDE